MILRLSMHLQKCMQIDHAYGSSSFGIVIAHSVFIWAVANL
jgi:hypothetical protein